jgi:hypothetical protein
LKCHSYVHNDRGTLNCEEFPACRRLLSVQLPLETVYSPISQVTIPIYIIDFGAVLFRESTYFDRQEKVNLNPQQYESDTLFNSKSNRFKEYFEA